MRNINITLVILTISMVSMVKPVSAQTRYNNYNDPNATCMAPPFCARYYGKSKAKQKRADREYF